MDNDRLYLSKCRHLIDKKLGWGDSRDWQTQDFVNLSDRIFEETTVLLSTTTLKRIWGKVRYESVPNLSTLNALAQFAGFLGWREFIASQQAAPEKAPGPEAAPALPVKKNFRKRNLLIGVSLLITIFICFSLLTIPARRLNGQGVTFSSKPVTQGVPNTVIFKYDASRSNADSVFIQQSWDLKKRFKVDPQLHEYTSTYYLPGYYRAKLILNDSIIREHDVKIETAGWMGMLENGEVPIYLPPKQFQHEGAMGFDENDLRQLSVNTDKEVPVFTLTKVDSSFDSPGQHFSLLVRLQNTYRKSNGICQHTFVTLFGTEGVINIPLTRIGCVGEIGLIIGMHYISGKTNDLSAFGVDFSKEVELRIESKNEMLNIFVNEKLAYSTPFKKNIGRTVGAKITFMGTGKVGCFEFKKG